MSIEERLSKLTICDYQKKKQLLELYNGYLRTIKQSKKDIFINNIYSSGIQKKVILIVGAGPVGLYTAYKFLQKSNDYCVHIVEKRPYSSINNRNNVLYISNFATPNPIVQNRDNNNLKKFLLKNGMCLSGDLPPIGEGSYCFTEREYKSEMEKNRADSKLRLNNILFGYTITTKLLQLLLLKFININYSDRFYIEYEKSFSEDYIKELPYKINLVVGADGRGSITRQIMGVMTEPKMHHPVFGLTANIPCDIVPVSKIFKHRIGSQQNQWRMFPAHKNDMSCDDYSHYIGLNITQDEYNRWSPIIRSENNLGKIQNTINSPFT